MVHTKKLKNLLEKIVKNFSLLKIISVLNCTEKFKYIIYITININFTVLNCNVLNFVKFPVHYIKVFGKHNVSYKSYEK